MLRIIRINSGDSAKDMARKLNMSASYLSAIETGKRNIPADMEELLDSAYDLSEHDRERLHNAILESCETVKIDLTELAEKKKQMIYEITRGNLDEETIDELYKILQEKKDAGK
jgi:transcriptional regulator with XRE-family HTH domain